MALLALVAAVACPEHAAAGTYTVSGCRTSWVAAVRNTGGTLGPTAFDACSFAPWALYASLGLRDRVNPGDYAGWRFDAPDGTSVQAVRLHWAGRGDYAGPDHGAVEINLVGSSDPQPRRHHEAFDEMATVETHDASWVFAYITCAADAGGSCRGYVEDSGSPTGTSTPYLYVRSSTVVLADRMAPVVDTAGGAALIDATWTGPEPLSFSASDRGGGLYRVLVDVDGQIVQAGRAVDDDRCVDRTGGRDFAYPVPCPTQASGTVTIDPAGLPGGHHTVTVYLEDAGGNRAILVPATQKLIVNDYRAVGYFAGGRFLNPRFGMPRVANGQGAVSDARIAASFVRVVGKGRRRHRVGSARREVRFTQRPIIKGTLTTSSGSPIGKATVFIGQQPEGQQWRLEGAVRTDASGRFSYRPAARQPNRRLRAVYFPFSDSHEYVATGPLALRVRAGLTLHVDRHALRNGQRLTFTGRVLGDVPAAGVAVTLQAKVGRHYRSFRQLRASARTGGRIRTVYRFERTTATARYRFRIKLVRQAGLPYQGGVSPTVGVLVRP